MPGFDQSDPPAAPVLAPGQLPEPLPADPFPIFQSWFDFARGQRTQPNPNAMTLATIDPDGRPAARVVLCKIIDPERGFVVFFTNYRGRKGLAIESNPRAAAVFHWDHLDLQVRIEGPVVRSPKAESDAYFASRPWKSRVGAWASEQSRPIASRSDLLHRFEAAMRRFGIDPQNPPPEEAAVGGEEIPRPPHWGGYRLWAERLELWIGGAARIHDRALWTRTLHHAPPPANGEYIGGPWSATRLQP